MIKSAPVPDTTEFSNGVGSGSSIAAYALIPSAASASGTGIAATVIAEIKSITADVFLIRLRILLSNFFLLFPNIKIHLLLSFYDIGTIGYAPPYTLFIIILSPSS